MIHGLIYALFAFLAASCGGSQGEKTAPAFFVMKPADVAVGDTTFAEYGLTVTNSHPSFDVAGCREMIREDGLVFLYVNAFSVPEYRADLFEKFAAEDYFPDPETGEPLSIHKRNFLLRFGRPAGVTIGMVAAGWATAQGYDGVYLDEAWGEVPRWVLLAMGAEGVEWEKFREEAAVQAETIVQTIRLAAPGVIVSGNVGREPEKAKRYGLDGITIEAGHLEWEPGNRKRFVEAFREYDPRYCVSWDWDAGPAARRGVTRPEPAADGLPTVRPREASP